MRAKIVEESIHFERGINPKEAMGIGLRIKSLEHFNEILEIYNKWSPNNVQKNIDITNTLLKKLKLEPKQDSTLYMVERCFDIINLLTTEIERIPKEKIISYDYTRMRDLINLPLKEAIMDFINIQSDNFGDWEFPYQILPSPDTGNLDRWGVQIIQDCIKKFKKLTEEGLPGLSKR